MLVTDLAPLSVGDNKSSEDRVNASWGSRGVVWLRSILNLGDGLISLARRIVSFLSEKIFDLVALFTHTSQGLSSTDVLQVLQENSREDTLQDSKEATSQDFDIERLMTSSFVMEGNYMHFGGLGIKLHVPPTSPLAMPISTYSGPTFKSLFESVGHDVSAFQMEESVVLSILEENNAKAVNGKIPYKKENTYGFIEKRDLPEESQIFVRADLHGDLKSLIENLRICQEQGLLDENFKCKENTHLVFLGDYGDRGTHSMEVLAFLAVLRMENEHQVTLIRGNHESLQMNIKYGGLEFASFVQNNSGVVEAFYDTLPLTLYLGQQTSSGNREYVHFTHGLFELSTDPVELLEQSDAYAYKHISEQRVLSGRMKLLAAFELNEDRKHDKYVLAARRIQQLYAADLKRDITFNLTAFNWGNVKEEPSCLLDLGNRVYHLAPSDVKAYQVACSTENVKVKVLFRGHQHEQEHFCKVSKDETQKIIVSTMPVGMESPYKQLFHQDDRGYLIKTAPEVCGWTKRAVLRAPSHPIINPYPESRVCEEVGLRDPNDAL